MKKIFAKALCFVLAFSLIFCFAACTGSTTGENSADDAVYKIGICQFSQHAALDEATEGFKAALKQKLGDKVVFDYQNASGENTNTTTICSKFVSDGVDLILANSTASLTAAASATSEIPVVGTSITDYASALGFDEWTGVTGYNVTGVSDIAPLDKQAQVVREIVPDAKTVGILYCSTESNSKYQADTIIPYFEAMGLTVKIYTFVDVNDIFSLVTTASQECDVIYTPTDNQVAAIAGAVNNVLESAGIPLVAGDTGTCKLAGVAVAGIDYYDTGFVAGEMAYEILVNGANPAEMEIRTASVITKMYVPERCEFLGITAPEDYVDINAES
ncbi:MAG: ABC transporter substrate-binding protein [Clostridia bacterium]|nr:ABC transporter substrate-binding protein [Clostridia bacterium]